MPINPVPDRGGLVYDAMGRQLVAEPTWREFFRSVFYALFGFKRTFTATLSFNFGNLAAGGEETTTVACLGARQGDAVIVTARTLVAGLGVDAMVSANDVITVRRFNFSTGAINPGADDFRLVVFQQ